LRRDTSDASRPPPPDRSTRHNQRAANGFRLRNPSSEPPISTATDTDLVSRCLEGDRASWAALLERYGDLVYGLAHRAGLDRASCADVFQDVSVQLWRRLSSLRRAESLLPWIATTARRAAWRARKRSRARALREEASARRERSEDPPPDESLALLEEEQVVRRALAALGERCRRLLAALYFDPSSPSYDEISARLGMPRGSLGPTRQRCLEGLRREAEALGLRADVSADPSSASIPAGRARRPAADATDPTIAREP